jgi:tryptophan 2,3-dioxygenase
MNQISYTQNIKTDFFAERLMRISRYFDITPPLSVWKRDGWAMKFRNTLTPTGVVSKAVWN